MDLGTGDVLCKAKALTTREDLCIGIRGALEALDKASLSEVGVVALSSTLATNSVVEGKGCRVGLICIGSSYDGSVPADAMLVVPGGHDLQGREAEPLDESSAEIFIESIRGRVDGLAVNGYLAVRNPDHERRIRDMAKRILDVPVVCGHELSSSLGFNERAATCIMNARLIPVIDGLISSVRAVLSEKGINAPLMIVRGDGSMMSEVMARERPVETVLSGPAASLIGAKHLTGEDDAIVMDMGGTTTDIGILRGGRPRLDPEGAVIAGKRTRVVAAQIATSGIGGDSRIFAVGRRVILSSVRVQPICMAACRWPSVRDHMLSLRGKEARPVPDSSSEGGVVLESEMFWTISMPRDPSMVSDTDMLLLDLLRDGPMSLSDAGRRLGVHPLSLNASRLESQGFLQRIGLTPTDILHAEGTYTDFDRESSLCAVEFLSRTARMDPLRFLDECKGRIRDKLCMELMKELLTEEVGTDRLGPAGEDLLMKAIRGTAGRDYGCGINLRKPIIGIGAPAGVYIRWVGDAFGARVIVHPDSDVGNAVGAVTSSVSETLEVLIRPRPHGADGCRYLTFSRLGNHSYGTLEEAVDGSVATGSEFVRGLVEQAGATDISVAVERIERKYTIGGDDAESLMEMTLRITAAGRPDRVSFQ